MLRPALLLMVSISLLQGCSNMFFIPMERLVRTPADIGLQYREVEFESSDGTKLHGWFLPAEGAARGSTLFLHGNAENISTHIGSVHWLPAEGYNVLLFDYRGYGKSGGVPELHGVIRDAEAAIEQIVKMEETDHTPIIVYGQSIGASIAIYAVAHSQYREHIDALIAESAFAGYRRIAREKLSAFWLTWPFQYPLSWTVSAAYAPIDAAPKIAPIPLLLVYSEEDRIVPAHHGELLYKAAKQPKQLWRVPNGQHISVFFRPEQRQRLLDYLESVTQP
ncbi:hypothetical protein Tel_00035 [Candidatus Tenderia electrophaga]|jgi:hypothetical protein|uniref:Serine aminopeptidase S33 domain-containing protein n=1 Tax=Candidatus Tenderia electrophaga TaxID=1748243 RepID=A0A0S2T910_9GAMM|nr:hypothetical protein Tel_00035 [Candidatus Tenderia electrophaga]